MATEFGKRLAKARKHAQLTQDQLAARTGMAQSTLAAAESKGAGSRKVAQIAAACTVNAHWLATGEGEMLDGIVNVAAMPRAQYRVEHVTSLESTISQLGELLAAHSAERRETVAGVLSRFALDPGNADLQNELALQLQAPGRAAHTKRAAA